MTELVDAGQAHLFSGWPEPGEADEDKLRLVKQLVQLDSSYAGGLLKYISNAKQLLKESKEGVLEGGKVFLRRGGDPAGRQPAQRQTAVVNGWAEKNSAILSLTHTRTHAPRRQCFHHPSPIACPFYSCTPCQAPTRSRAACRRCPRVSAWTLGARSLWISRARASVPRVKRHLF